MKRAEARMLLFSFFLQLIVCQDSVTLTQAVPAQMNSHRGVVYNPL